MAAQIVGEVPDTSSRKGPRRRGPAPEFQKLLPQPAERVLKFELPTLIAFHDDSLPLHPGKSAERVEGQNAMAHARSPIGPAPEKRCARY